MSSGAFSAAAEVTGRFQKLREKLHPVLIAIFLLLPWFTVGGEPVLLLDFFSRRFIIFGVSFFSHDMPLLFYLLILVILAIFLVTALFGRIWCGWSCPQTVFIHGLFDKIEKALLGPFAKRRALMAAPDSTQKTLRLLGLYLCFLAACWLLSHSLAAYFVGADRVLLYISEGPARHLQSFAALGILTLLLFFNFAFFREKLCSQICPYGRFQNALIDNHSLVVQYNSAIGEPRGKATAELRGNCIDCRRCVTVCPVKIDIRDGFQFDCIACGKCIDACNDVMKKAKQPENLISYEAGSGKKLDFLRFRVGLYAGLILIFAATFAVSLKNRTAVEFSISRAVAVPFQIRIEGGSRILQNQLKLHLKNMSGQVLEVDVALAPDDLAAGFRFLTPAEHIRLNPGEDIQVPGFVEIPEVQYFSTGKTFKIVLQPGSSQPAIVRSLGMIRAD